MDLFPITSNILKTIILTGKVPGIDMSIDENYDNIVREYSTIKKYHNYMTVME